MTDLVIIAILVLVVGGAAGYICKAKKAGVKCVGCPHSKTCSGNCGGNGSCGSR